VQILAAITIKILIDEHVLRSDLGFQEQLNGNDSPAGYILGLLTGYIQGIFWWFKIIRYFI
jgi:hypothetical protein